MIQMKTSKINIKLAELMANKNLTKNELCRLSDVGMSTINNYCNNTIKLLDVNVLCKLCNALDCKISELMEYEKD